MMRFLTQMNPKIPNGPNLLKHPQCLAIVKGNFVPRKRNYVEKTDKDHPDRKSGVRGREEKEHMPMPGFVHPDPMNEEGYFTQKARQQIEEHKKIKKDKPTLRNPEGRE